ncbi:MAG: RNA polymerase sigma-70 factor [Bacteroidetes bacterium]|nr:RNA polymerase sigma-70 factor [Bacteroidota bacterium]
MMQLDIYLFNKMKEGDQHAFNFIFTKHYSDLVNFAMVYLKEVSEAEEIVQNVFLKLWEEREEIDIHSSLKAYLMNCIKNRCLDYFKHQRIIERYNDRISKSQEQYIEEADKYLMLSELEKQINSTINLLPSTCKNIFNMSRIEGKKNREIAEELNISIKTVEANIGRALKVLRANLVDYLVLLVLGMVFLWNSFNG